MGDLSLDEVKNQFGDQFGDLKKLSSQTVNNSSKRPHLEDLISIMHSYRNWNQQQHPQEGPTRLKLTKPVIGAIEGHAVAGGMELALMCDLRVVAEDAVMGMFNRRFGVPTVDGGTVRLPYIVGLSRALDLIMTGRAVHATEALYIGLANRVVPKGKTVEEAVKLAKMLVCFPREALCADRKSVFYATFNADSFYDALTYEYSKGVKLQIMKDSIEGAKQFLQGKGRKGSFDDYLD